MPPPPLPLPDDVIEQILLRVSPSDPACLFRACAVCRSWLNLVSNRKALDRYREHHRVPPVMGFFHNEPPAGPPPLLPADAEYEEPRFVPTCDPSPPFPTRRPDLDGTDNHWVVLDARHGRVLVYAFGMSSSGRGVDLSLRVWDPITGAEVKIPMPPDGEPAVEYQGYAGAVLCADAAAGCDHQTCAAVGGPFRVVFAPTGFADVDPDDDGEEDADLFAITWVRVYSSETGAWSDPTIIHPGDPQVPSPLDQFVMMGPSLLLGDTLYFTLELNDRRVFLVYHHHHHHQDDGDDYVVDVLTTLDGPEDGGRGIFPVADADGGLGAVAVEGYFLRTWSGRPPPAQGQGQQDEGAAWVWTPTQSIDLSTAIPLDLLGGGVRDPGIRVVGHAEDLRVVFVSDDDGVYMVDLDSGRIVRASTMRCLYPVLPYTAFYTYGLISIQMMLLQEDTS